MSDNFKIIKFFNKIDTVNGKCEHCGQETILVAVVTEFYRCTICGEDTRQHINGSIRYLQVTEDEKKWLRKQNSVQSQNQKEISRRKDRDDIRKIETTKENIGNERNARKEKKRNENEEKKRKKRNEHKTRKEDKRKKRKGDMK